VITDVQMVDEFLRRLVAVSCRGAILASSADADIHSFDGFFLAKTYVDIYVYVL
jgi:hypothetical protein